MLHKEEWIVIQHYLDQGWNQAAIARTLGVSRRTIYRYAHGRKRPPRYGPRPIQPGKLDLFKPYLRQRLQDLPQLTGTRLFREIAALGYTGQKSILWEFLRTCRPPSPVPIVERFEVAPGQQAQVDFAFFRTPFGPIFALLVVLSWSRLLWAQFFHHQDLLTLLAGLHRVLVSFGGVPRTLLFDRMRTAVSGQDAAGQPIFGPELLRFAHHYGFHPQACRPYRACTKGRVERAISYLRQDFFYGRTVHNLADLNNQCRQWLAEVANRRIHAITGEAPQARWETERDHLSTLPSTPFVPLVTVGRRLSRDGYLSYNGNEYSVPAGIGTRQLEVRATLERLEVFQGEVSIASHPLCWEKGLRLLDPAHRSRKDMRTAIVPSSDVDPWAGWETIEVERRPLAFYDLVRP